MSAGGAERGPIDDARALSQRPLKPALSGGAGGVKPMRGAHGARAGYGFAVSAPDVRAFSSVVAVWPNGVVGSVAAVCSRPAAAAVGLPR